MSYLCMPGYIARIHAVGRSVNGGRTESKVIHEFGKQGGETQHYGEWHEACRPYTFSLLAMVENCSSAVSRSWAISAASSYAVA